MSKIKPIEYGTTGKVEEEAGGKFRIYSTDRARSWSIQRKEASLPVIEEWAARTAEEAEAAYLLKEHLQQYRRDEMRREQEVRRRAVMNEAGLETKDWQVLDGTTRALVDLVVEARYPDDLRREGRPRFPPVRPPESPQEALPDPFDDVVIVQK